MSEQSNCAICGAVVGGPPGSQCPQHQAAGEREQCPGSGQPTQ
jgi:hypothetical protein